MPKKGYWPNKKSLDSSPSGSMVWRIKKHKDRLAHLGIPSLQLRRLHLNVIYHFSDLMSLETKTFFTFNPVSVTRGHAYKLYKPQHDCALLRNFFVERVVNAWNSLPKCWFLIFI